VLSESESKPVNFSNKTAAMETSRRFFYLSEFAALRICSGRARTV